jgi:hypothetical protein
LTLLRRGSLALLLSHSYTRAVQARAISPELQAKVDKLDSDDILALNAAASESLRSQSQLLINAVQVFRT